MERDAERGDEKAGRERDGRREHRLARSDALDPAAEDRGRESEKDDRGREHPADRAQLPVGGRGLGAADQAGQRQVEDAEGVRLADAEMNRQRGRRHAPPREVRGRNGVVAIEKGERRHGHNLVVPAATSPDCSAAGPDFLDAAIVEIARNRLPLRPLNRAAQTATRPRVRAAAPDQTCTESLRSRSCLRLGLGADHVKAVALPGPTAARSRETEPPPPPGDESGRPRRDQVFDVPFGQQRIEHHTSIKLTHTTPPRIFPAYCR